jgi:hypothetical protein
MFILLFWNACMMARQTAASPMELRSIQQGTSAGEGTIDYYDIMVIGRTGMGKSTTSDKLVIANLNDRNYRGEQHPDESEEGVRVAMSDLSMWLISDVEGEMDRVTRRLKNLIMFRGLEKPHEEVNSFYNSLDGQATIKSQLISNETTTVRVLDVPGFFGEAQSGAADAKDIDTESVERVTSKGLAIMREVLRIQATMQMNFRRIVYFIPERGPLERAHQVLQIEMELMVHYFGKSIFDCMVLVATVNPDVYQYIPPDVVPFSNDAERKTRNKFDETLKRVLPKGERLPSEKPPIIFLSMNDSCEDIFWKIKHAPVIIDRVRLAFDHPTCSRCGIKAKFIRDKQTKVACYAGEDPMKSIPYEESLCHPLIIPKYWEITKIVGGIAHFITRKKFLGKWPNFHNPDDEICIECGQVPGTHGCMLVNSRYKPKPGQEGELVVDHHCELTEQVVLEVDPAGEGI